MKTWKPFLVLFFLFLNYVCHVVGEDSKLLVITVASHETDGYKRFVKSAQVYGLNVLTLGLNQPWRGGGYKVNLLKQALDKMELTDKLVLLVTDSYDVILDANASELLKRFIEFGANIVFSAEKFCWLETNLCSKYPEVKQGYRFLNSATFIGYAKDVKDFLNKKEIEDLKDDRLFYSVLFLNKEMRDAYKIVLDSSAVLFQNLFGSLDNVTLNFDQEFPYLTNTKFNTNPVIIHANEKTEIFLNSFGNYLAKPRSNPHGCTSCSVLNQIEKLNPNHYPSVNIAIFIEKPTAFLEELLNKVANLNYPAKKISMFVYNSQEYHALVFDIYIHNFKKMFRKVKYVAYNTSITSTIARNLALQYSITNNVEFFFFLDGDVQLENPNVLKILVDRNESFVAPLLVRPFKAWSNFWGALNPNGYYERSFDYMDIINSKKKNKGLWNVPFINNCYLIKMSVLRYHDLHNVYSHELLDPDMALCSNMRDKGIFMKIDSTLDFGHLVNNEKFNLQKVSPEIFELVRNPLDWNHRYIHPDYSKSLLPETVNKQPCPDVFWFPIVTERFCKEFVEIIEHYGQWSDGSHNDSRLESGYEAVPTRDIHMNQVGLAGIWAEFLRKYVNPVQEREFIGYFQEAPRESLPSFIVRYKPDEQPALEPHHDHATFTINIALNRAGIDYEGGGCRFIRYNCSVTDTKIGWMLMHPGRLTHYHEGLPVTKGTRYIMVTFVDP